MIAQLQRILPFPRLSALCAALLAAACAAWSLTGCQTSHSSFPQPAANWQSFQGQLRYSSAAGRSVIGDVVIRRSPQGDFQLEFQSGPGIPLMRLWKFGDLVRAEGALARGSWQGTAEKAPKPLRGWVALPSAFAHQGHAKRLDVSRAGDHFVFQFGN